MQLWMWLIKTKASAAAAVALIFNTAANSQYVALVSVGGL